VGLDGGQAHVQARGDLGIGGSVGDRGGHLAFPRRQRSQAFPCLLPAGGGIGVAGDQVDQAAGYPG